MLKDYLTGNGKMVKLPNSFAAEWDTVLTPTVGWVFLSRTHAKADVHTSTGARNPIRATDCLYSGPALN